MSFDAGALVRVRGREWVVMPESDGASGLYILRPLGGTDDEITGIYHPIEPIVPADFQLPNPKTDMGDHLSCGMLRDAVRLGFRSGAGPFRSLARVAVEPRPYQIVPLLMAMKLSPVRMLIADDVGIGKTIEACLIARELRDRGEIRRLAVLCPPQLAEQWQLALSIQFHLPAVLVLSGTAARLERDCNQDESLFEHYPFTVVSTDYIKSDKRRHEFLRTCPELVIVDEAHTCTAGPGRSASQKRHELLRDLVDPTSESCARRHLILVTATPHSGNPDAFRSLLTLVDPAFADLPRELSGKGNQRHRERLARHLVQRRRGDLAAYLDTVTPFPKRKIAEEHYSLSPAYSRFLKRVLDYCRERVLDASIDKRRQRVRWWSALALLRALSSSPAAVAATLRNRSSSAQGGTVEQVDREGRRAVLDLDDESMEGLDVVPGSASVDPDEEDDTHGAEGEAERERRRLSAMAREAEKLTGKNDHKLTRALEIVAQLLEQGFSPILFCRFIPTVEYLAEALRKKLKRRGVHVETITGELPPQEREARVADLGQYEKRVLVCTDCLSEGINLQEHLNAVIHYDLSWNPTRHEQREGRVDRYGQKHDTVRTLTYYGEDNPVDEIVLRVLLRKHNAIHKALGISVPIPMDNQIIENAILEGVLKGDPAQLNLDFNQPVDIAWDKAAEREKRNRTIFCRRQPKNALF